MDILTAVQALADPRQFEVDKKEAIEALEREFGKEQTKQIINFVKDNRKL